ncbi:Glycerol-3-phosphate acyltransferase 2, mitochondrial [Merluccius polli]|uniref:Glycerol-3-phosphate acyltransferase 2, mitochondrial n=1 Tax=Merluccius polli TaxID=89951 RepID=A0AA47MQA0_MERPO|nr:Glycerol-3-phosphate acyltransferase 2, mitochondrial [Merluccius polli]
MVQDVDTHLNDEVHLSPALQTKPASSWGVKVKKRLKIVTPYLGKFRPTVGHCCHQCTPESLGKTPGQKTSLGFHNVVAVDETQIRYRGWLVRRVCCVLFVSGCNVYPSPAGDRLHRVRQSIRVQEALAEEHTAPTGPCCMGNSNRLSPYHSLMNTCISPCFLRFGCWLCLKTLGSVFSSIQVNLNHLAALHHASQQGSPLVYVFMRQSVLDYVLVPLVLFSQNLRVPYTFCPQRISFSWLRSFLQKVGVVFLPFNALTEDDAEADNMYSPAMTALLRELLCEGQALSVSVCGETGHGGQWLARIRQVIKEGTVPDVSLVPVGISYDCIPDTGLPAGLTQVGLCSSFRCLWSLLWSQPSNSLRVHFAQPFSLKEMCTTGRCRVDGWRPLQELLLPNVLDGRTDDVVGQKMMSWILPSQYAPELIQSERDLSTALTLHLIYSTTSCMAVMSTGLVASLLLHRHRKGVFASALCRDVAWLTEELLFRNKDVGFGGSLPEVVSYALVLLGPRITVVSTTSRKDPFVIPRPSLDAITSLSVHAQIVTHSFITEAVGACAVSAMLYEVAGSGVSSRVRRSKVHAEEVKSDMEFDVALCETQLTQRTLQLCHLLPPGFVPPCQSSYSFALDAVDSLVRCGILVMEEVTRDAPVCDLWRKHRGLSSWPTTDDPYHSDSDCEEPDARSYKLSRPSQCPEMIFFLCSMLAGHLRALCWATEGVQHLATPMPVAECVAQIHSHLRNRAKQDKHYESCTEEAARIAVRTLTELGVLVEERQGSGTSLTVGPLFQLADNRQKLQLFISQYLYS